MRKWWWLGLLLGLIACGSPSATVDPSQFEVKGLTYDISGDIERASAAGEVVNRGTVAAAPKIEVVFRDPEGRVVATHSRSADRNIAPGDSWPFSTGFLSAARASTATARVVEAKHCGGSCY
jgi:hypothetical protein